MVEDLGTAYGIAGILRAAPFCAAGPLFAAGGRHAEQVLAASCAQIAGVRRPPRVALAAALPAAYARRDLARHKIPRAAWETGWRCCVRLLRDGCEGRASQRFGRIPQGARHAQVASLEFGFRHPW